MKKEIVDLSSKVLPEYGFKFLKGKCEGTKQSCKFNNRITLSVSNQDFSFLACGLLLPNFKLIRKEIIVTGKHTSDSVIGVTTSYAYPIELKEIEHEFYGSFYFGHGYPPNRLEAYERLLRNYAMPWFERFKTYADVCEVLRKNAISNDLWMKTWNNTDLTPRFSGTNFHVAFGVDAILSKLDKDEGENLHHVYETYYQKGMKNFLEKALANIKDEMDERITGEMKTIYDEMPQLIERINNIPKAKWEEYRKMVSLK